MDLFLFANKFICMFFFFQIPHVSDIWHFSLSVWLASVSMIVSRLLHAASNGVLSSFGG